MWPGFIKKESNIHAATTSAGSTDSVVASTKKSPKKTSNLQLLLPTRELSCGHFDDKLFNTEYCERYNNESDNDSIKKTIKQIVVDLCQRQSSLSSSSEDQSILKRLLSPSISAFAAPWIVSCLLVSTIRQLITDTFVRINHASIHSVLSIMRDDINQFLNGTSVFWFEESRKLAKIAGEDDDSTSRRRAIARRQLFSPRKAIHGALLTEESPRYFMLEMLREINQSLFHDTTNVTIDSPDALSFEFNQRTPEVTHLKKYKLMLLEIAVTIISISKRLNQKLLDECMDVCFMNVIGRGTIDIVLYITFAVKSKLYLRIIDWDSIYEIVKKRIEASTANSLQSNFCDLVPHLVSLCFTGERPLFTKKNSLKSPDFEWIRWQKLVIHVLMLATVDPGLYTKTEETLMNSISLLNFEILALWIKGVEMSVFEKKAKRNVVTQQNITKEKDLAELNTILLTYRATKAHVGSEIAAYVLNECFHSQSHVIQHNLVDSCRELVSRKFIDMSSISNKIYNDQQLKQLLQGAVYVGNGCFASKEQKTISCLSKVATIVHRSLFLCDSVGFDREFLEECAKIRAETLSILGLSLLKSYDPVDSHSYICAVVCIAVVYIEVKSSRIFIAEGLRKLICIQNQSQQKSEIPVFCFSGLLTILVNSYKMHFSAEASSELDKVADIFVHPMPSPVFFALSRALLPLLSVRRILLSLGHSQICLPLAPERWIRSRGQELDTSVKALEAMKCGLLALVLLISFTPWTDCEAKAWIIMSTFLVDGSHYIPFSTRSWLILKIMRLVNEDFFETSIQEHLIRACLIRILRFVYKDDNGSDCFAFSNCYHWSLSVFATENSVDPCLEENITAFFCLTLALIRRLCSRKQHCLSVYHSCRLILQGLVPINPQNPGKEQFSELLVPLPREIGSDDWLVVVFFQVFILSLNENGFLDSADWGSVSLTEIGSLLAHRELGTMERFLSISNTPSWMKLKNEQFKPSTNLSIQQVGRVQTTLLDLLVEIFAGHKNASYDCKQTLSGKLSVILTRKRLFVRDIFNHIGQKQRSSIKSSNCLKLTLSLIELFASDVNGIVSRDGDFFELKCIIESLKEFCEYFGDKVAEGSPGTSQHLHVIAQIYMSLVTESESLKFIAYLEKKCVGHIHSICLFPLSTSHEIDVFVRHLRCIILKCMKQVLQSVLAGIVSTAFPLGVASHDLSIAFMLKVIDTLVADLREGLEGKSGGVSNDMFGFYVDSVEMSTLILIEMSEKINSMKDVDDVLEICCIVQRRLDDVLRSFDINQPNLARKTIFLCTRQFPAIAQRICNKDCVINCVERAMKTIRNFKIGFKLFEELADVLRHRVETGRQSSEEWLDFVNSDHLSEDSRDVDEANPVSVLSSFFGRDRGSPTRKKRRSNRLKKIRLCREDSWSLSFTCLLDVFEHHWNDQISFQSTRCFSTESIQGYFSCRTEELILALESVTLLFRDSARLSSLVSDEIEFASDQSVDSVYLPMKVKLSLLSLVGKILSASTKSTCNLVNLLSKIEKDTNINLCSFATADDLAVVFSIAALRSKYSDFMAGLLQWIHLEKRKKAQDSPISRKLLKGLHGSQLRFEELELMFRKLWQTLKCRTVNPDRDSKNLIEYINTFLPRSKSKEAGASFSFLQLIMDRMLFNDERKSQIVAVQASFVEPCDQKSIDTNKKRPASLRNHFRSTRSPRSRNEIVNKWIKIDRENTDFSSSDEVDNDETYPDLEDFIVDG